MDRVGDYLIELLEVYVDADDLQAVARGIIDILEDNNIPMDGCADIFDIAQGTQVDFELEK